MKALLISLGMVFVLSGCFGSTTTTTDTGNLTSFSGSGFTMQVPKTWTAVALVDLPKPKNGTVVGAFTSLDITSGFANNLLILKDTLNTDADPTMNSRKYAVVNKALVSGDYLEYTSLSESDITFPDGDKGLLTTFEARYNTSTPKQEFLQTAKICGKNVYLLTIGLNL